MAITAAVIEDERPATKDAGFLSCRRLLFVDGREGWRRIDTDGRRNHDARPEIRRPLTFSHLVHDRLQATLDVRRDCPKIRIRHVAPCGPRHRRRQVVRHLREVAWPAWWT